MMGTILLLLLVFDARPLGVGLEQRQAERLGEVDGKETRRQLAGRHVGIVELCCGAGRALFGDDGEAVIGGDEHVGRRLQSELF